MNKLVTFILPSLKGGGAEKVFINIAYYLANKNYTVELVTLQNKNDYQINFSNLKINYINFNKKRSFNSFFNILFYLKNTKSNVIFTTFTHVNIMLFVLNFFFKKKIIFRESNNTDLSLNDLPYLKRLFFIFFIKKISQKSSIIYPSEYLKKSILNKYNILDKNKFVINNPISIKINDKINYSILEKIERIKNNFSKIIINIGSFTKQKNHEDLINVFSQIQNIKNKCLILVGNGPLKKNLQKLIYKKNLKNNIFIFNFQNDLTPFFKISNLYVSTSLWEGFPNVLLDAANNNIPIISYNCKFGPYEILEGGKYGLLCKLGDKEELLKLIKFAFKDKIKIIPKNHLHSKYSLDYIGKKYEALIK